MHFMRPANGSYIGGIAFGKPFKPLVNDHIMYQKIGKPVSHDTKANGLHPPDFIIGAKENQENAWNGEYDKKRIILFKKSGFNLVMIPVQIPEEPMHYIFVREPGNTFHNAEGSQQYQYV